MNITIDRSYSINIDEKEYGITKIENWPHKEWTLAQLVTPEGERHCLMVSEPADGPRCGIAKKENGTATRHTQLHGEQAELIRSMLLRILRKHQSH